MAVNLIELAKDYLTPDVVNTLSGTLGESSERTEKAVEAGLPEVLAGFLKTAANPAGAGRLFDMLKQEPPELSQMGGLDGSLGNLGGLLSGASLGNLIKVAQPLLRMIFGGNLSSILDV